MTHFHNSGDSMPSPTEQLRADGVSKIYGDRRVLDGIDLVAGPLARIAVIGENGAGKSTLLRVLAGDESPDSGTVTRPARTGFLRQELSITPGASLHDVLEQAIADVRDAEREVEAAAADLGRTGDDRRYSMALESAEHLEVWSIDSRRDAALAGLGISHLRLDRPVGSISGGQRSRLALAALLLSRPTALLLDEPTNHLDDAATDFLRSQISVWRGPVMLASHDRAFVDEVATSILDIDPSERGPRRFGGGYTAYLEQKALDRARWEATFAGEQAELVALRHSVEVTARAVAPARARTDNDKMGYDFKTGRIDKQVSRRVRNARERLDELTENQVRKPTPVLAFAGIPPGSHILEGDGDVLAIDSAAVPGRLEPTTLRVRASTSLLITGANGAGKSTLLAALAGRLPLGSGRVIRRRGLRVALLEQDVRFVDPAESARALYERTLGDRLAESTPLYSLGLLAPRDIDRPIGALSLGQQRRVALALIIAKPPHVFLLDEPTNHLSLALATELEDALGRFPGAVVVASHDRWLRRRWAGEHVGMSHGRLAA